MKTYRTAGITLAVLVSVGSVAGCSKRQIDPSETGSVNIPGTSWMRFCDGPNAVIWVPGRSGDADELEAYVYDHHECAPDFYGDDAVRPERPADEDGISEDAS